jgi:hypothetical protein
MAGGRVGGCTGNEKWPEQKGHREKLKYLGVKQETFKLFDDKLWATV